MTTPDPQYERFRYERDDERRRIRVVASGSLTCDDFADVLARQVREGTWIYSLMYDLRRHATPTSEDESQTLAARVFRALIHVGPRGPVAVVAWAPRVIDAATSYVLSFNRAGIPLEVFRTIEEAELWLDAQQSLSWC